MSEQAVCIERDYQVNGLTIHTLIWENPQSEAPTLVILHGIGDSSRLFAPVAARLAERRSVYALDLRGHGESDKPSAGYRFTDYGDDVLGVIEQLALPERPIDLLGHSLGALVGIHLAAGGNAHLGRLILEDPPLILDWGEQGVGGLMQFLLDVKHRPFPEVVSAVAADFPSLTNEQHVGAAQSLIKAADGPFVALAGGEQPPVDWGPLLSKIKVPTLVLAADPAAGGIVGPKQRAIFREYLPSARIVDFPGCNHPINADRTEDYLKAIEDFLSNPGHQAHKRLSVG